MATREPQTEREWIRQVGNGNGKEIPAHLSVATLGAILSVIFSVIYGMWQLNSSQVSGIKEIIEQLRKDADAKDIRLSAELSRREAELRAINNKQDEEIRAALKSITDELAARRSEFANIKEFNELKSRILDDIGVLRKQLTVLEATRPTVGELSAQASSLKDRIEKLYDILKGIEEWIRSRGSTAPK